MHRSGLTELDAVLAVAGRGSFRAAAKALGMSTSAVSHAVAGLESRLQARLFHRTTRSVALTEAGRRYVEQVAPAVAAIRMAAEEIHSDPDTPAGTLRINSSARAIAMFFQPVIVPFLQQHPQMRVEIVSNESLVDIVAEGFDAGVRLAEQVPQDMVAVPLGPDLRMVVVGSPAYLAEHGVPQSPTELTAHTCILSRMSHGGIHRWELERHGEALVPEIRGRLILDHMDTVADAAQAGLGLACLSEWHIAGPLHRGELVRVLDDWCPPFAGLRLYYPGHRHVPSGLRALVQQIRQSRIGEPPSAP